MTALATKLPENLKALEAFVLAAMKAHHIPGVSIGLIIDGVEHYVSLGVTSITNPLPVTPETLFQIGSTTKTFTATTAMKLVQDGLLEVDAPVRQYIPDFRVEDEDVSARVTVRHLMTHTSGWFGDFDLDTGDDSDALELYVQAMAELPQITPMDALMSYSNSAFVLLGRVLEVASGKTLDILVRETILEPLELNDTVFWAHEAITKRTAIGHKQSESDETVVIPVWRLSRATNADGGLVASARNQMRYARFQMGQLGDTPINAASRLEMQTPRVSAGGNEFVGLCWFIEDMQTTDDRNVHTVRHGGSVPGFQSHFWFAPQENFAFTCQTNAESGMALNTLVTAWVLEHLLNIPPRKQEAIAVTPAQLEAFTGWYVVPTGKPNEGLEVARNGDALTLRVDVPTFNLVLPAVPLKIISPTACVLLEGPMASMTLDFVAADGELRYLRAGGRIATRSTRTET
jgi:CubicO group peptidase (beta-lactamase class C family)